MVPLFCWLNIYLWWNILRAKKLHFVQLYCFCIIVFEEVGKGLVQRRYTQIATDIQGSPKSRPYFLNNLCWISWLSAVADAFSISGFVWILASLVESWDGISTLNLQSRPTSQDLPTIKGAQMHSHRRANLNIIPSDPAKNPHPSK